MADAEAVVFAFGAQAERRKTAESADHFELGAAPSEDFVWVSLMADIPDDAVVRRVETHMQRQRQLDGAEIGGEVTADTPQRLDQITAHFNGQRRQLRGWQLAQIVRCLDSPEQGVTGNIGHERSGAHGTLDRKSTRLNSSH